MLVAKKEIYDYDAQYDTKDYKVNKTKEKEKAQKTENVSLKIKVFFYATIILAVCIVVLLRYAYISQLKYDLGTDMNTVEELSQERQRLMLDLEQIKDSGRIEEIAKKELGLQYPTEQQVIYVRVGDVMIEEKNGQLNQPNDKAVLIEGLRSGLTRLTDFTHQ